MTPAQAKAAAGCSVSRPAPCRALAQDGRPRPVGRDTHRWRSQPAKTHRDPARQATRPRPRPPAGASIRRQVSSCHPLHAGRAPQDASCREATAQDGRKSDGSPPTHGAEARVRLRRTHGRPTQPPSRGRCVASRHTPVREVMSSRYRGGSFPYPVSCARRRLSPQGLNPLCTRQSTDVRPRTSSTGKPRRIATT